MSQNPDDRTVVQPYLGFDCTKLSPTEAYRLLNHLVAPRPIAFVSTISADGIPNLAPFSFFMAGGLNPPSVAESVMAMECQLYQIVSHGDDANSANYVIGEVVYFHVARYLMVNGEIDPTQVNYVSRMGGNWYDLVTSDSMFELSRPQSSKEMNT